MEDPQVKSGDHGETLVGTALAATLPELTTRAHLFRSMRVPRADEKGKFEIDFLLLTSAAILVIEVKNWSGRLALASGQIAQTKSDGGTRTFDDPLPLLAKKQEAVRQFLERNGIALAVQDVSRLVVLANDRVSIDGALAKNPQVVKLCDLAPLIKHRLNPPKVFWWRRLLQVFKLVKRAAPPIPFAATKTQLLRLPVWDEITLYGGKVWKGDIVDTQIPTRRAKFLGRRQARQVKVVMPRSLVWGWWIRPKIVVPHKAWRPSQRYVLQSPQAKITIRLAGQNRTEEVPLVHVRSITFGWRDESYYDSLGDKRRSR